MSNEVIKEKFKEYMFSTGDSASPEGFLSFLRRQCGSSKNASNQLAYITEEKAKLAAKFGFQKLVETMLDKAIPIGTYM